MLPILHLLLAAVGAILLLATLPLALELAVLSLAAILPSRDSFPTAASGLRLAVVVPAHNEEKMIAQCLATLRGASAVYVIAHNCSDRTAEVAAAAGATALVLHDSVGGKGNALDFGFRHALAAGADAVLVIDADSVADPRLIPAVSAAFAGGAQAVQCRYQVANGSANRRTHLVALAFLGINVLRPLGRHRLGLSCGIFGNGFALSAQTLVQVPYTSNSVVEDLEYHLHLIRAGIRVRFLNDAAVYGEMPESGGAATSQRARWEGGRMLMRRTWTGPLAAEVLRGNLRMLEPLLDLRALPLANEAGFLVVALGLGLASHLNWLTAYSVLALCAIVLYVLVAAMLGPEPTQTIQALVFAPVYLAWKMILIPRTRMAARADAAWVRTKRNVEGIPPEPPEEERLR